MKQASSSPVAPPAVDPFGYWPAARSAIAGLGGSEAPDFPSYIFHTPYLTPAEGIIRLSMQFEGLQATSGLMRLEVYEWLETKIGPHLLTHVLFNFRDLAARGGGHAIRLRARAGARYALLAHMVDAGDIAATGITAALDRWADDQYFNNRVQRAARSIFRRRSQAGSWLGLLPSPLERAGLISRRPATLADPMSQMCTAAQLDEPVAGAWLARMGFSRRLHRKQWEILYIIKVLEKFDMLKPGTRGLAFGIGHEFTPSLFAALGCTILATDLPSDERVAALWSASGQHADALAALHWPSLVSEEQFLERVSFRAVDMNHIPDDLQDFDFCWSACAYEHLGSIEQGLEFFKRSIRCLRPGGVAVHTTELNVSSNRATVAEGPTVLFRRQDLERLALDLLREGHDVLPITYDLGDLPVDRHIDLPPYCEDEHLKIALWPFVTTSFGMAVRRGRAT